MACGEALLINSFTFIRYRIDHGQFHSTSLRHKIYLQFELTTKPKLQTQLCLSHVSEVSVWLMGDV